MSQPYAYLNRENSHFPDENHAPATPHDNERGADLLIKNARLLLRAQGSLVTRNIVVENGSIKRIVNGSSARDYGRYPVFDAQGLVALPGLIDSHAHLREPGYEHKENWLTGSRAAAAGGVTTVLDMPNTSPSTLTAFDLERKRSLSQKSIVDYGLHLGASLARPLELNNKELIQQTAAVKFYFDPNNGDPWMPAFGSGRTRVIGMLQAVAGNGGLAVFHAKGSTVWGCLELARRGNCPAVVAHTPGRLELAHIARARSFNAAPVYCEVTPHHLLLTSTDVKELGPLARVEPVLGKKADQAVLWHALRHGLVDTIATDHAPHTLAEKLVGEAPPGIPGLETMLPLLLDARHRRLLTLQDIQRLCCENPSRIYRLKAKGFLRRGYDADIVLVDLKRKRRVRNSELFTKCGWSPFHREMLRGWPITTIVRGQPVFSEGAILAPERGGTGREVRYAARRLRSRRDEWPQSPSLSLLSRLAI